MNRRPLANIRKYKVCLFPFILNIPESGHVSVELKFGCASASASVSLSSVCDHKNIIHQSIHRETHTYEDVPLPETLFSKNDEKKCGALHVCTFVGRELKCEFRASSGAMLFSTTHKVCVAVKLLLQIVDMF